MVILYLGLFFLCRRFHSKKLSAGTMQRRSSKELREPTSCDKVAINFIAKIEVWTFTPCSIARRMAILLA